MRPRLRGIGNDTGSTAASAAGDGKTWVTGPPSMASGAPTAATMRPATVRAPATEICCPMTARTAVSNGSTLPGHAAARGGGDRRRQRRVLAERGVDGDGVGVEVEQAADAPHGRAEIAPVGEPQEHPHVRPAGATRAGGEGEDGDAVAVREVECAVERLAVPRLDARHGAGGEERHEVLGVERLATARSRSTTPAPERGTRPAAARSADGVAPNTWRTVSLNWRTLPNPAAKATDVKSMSVVSMRMRAVWARWARAMASGPAPSSSVRSRVRWRSL